MTEAKLNLIKVGRSEVDCIIIELYEDFKKEISCSEVEKFKPSSMKLQKYRLSIKFKCDIKQKGSGDRRGYCISKKEQYEMFDKLIENDKSEENI
jgi:hypothetical protein